MKHRTFPKEGMNKLRQTIQDLKAYIKELESRNDFLERQLNIIPPKDHEVDKMKKLKEGASEEELRQAWRLDFLKRMGRR